MADSEVSSVVSPEQYISNPPSTAEKHHSDNSTGLYESLLTKCVLKTLASRRPCAVGLRVGLGSMNKVEVRQASIRFIK